MNLPDISQLGRLSPSEQLAVLDNLFEHCKVLQAILLPVFSQSFDSYRHFIETCRQVLLKYLQDAENDAGSTGTIRPEISQIIAAHPRLGAAKKLSDHSSNEQKSLQGSTEEAQKLKDLNDQYEKTFPGLRYVVFVNGRPRSAIMQNMLDRIHNGDIRLERKEAFNAMCDIALDRAAKLEAKL